jgi:predicted O-methyltransferase YrrM
MPGIDQDTFYKMFKKTGNPYNIPFPAAQDYDVAVILALANIFKPKTFLEIGINLGHTARRILQYAPYIQSYVGIDIPFDAKETAREQFYEVPRNPGMVATDPRLRVVTREYGVANIDPIELGKFDFIFIDGDHSTQGIKTDTEYCEKIIEDNGVIFWHDFPGIQAVYDYVMSINKKDRIWHVYNTNMAFRIGKD